jgi:hypothetical protein
MIHVAPSQDCATLMHLAGISLELLTRTVNDRHHGLVNDSLNRVLAVHWLNSESAIFLLDRSALKAQYPSYCRLLLRVLV